MWTRWVLAFYLIIFLAGSKGLGYILGESLRTGDLIVGAVELGLGLGILLGPRKHAYGFTVCALCLFGFLAILALDSDAANGCACFGGVLEVTQTTRMTAASLGGFLCGLVLLFIPDRRDEIYVAG